MGDRSHIEWTDATSNPVTGCTPISAGCDHCYAKTLADRLQRMGVDKYSRGVSVQTRRRAPPAIRYTVTRMGVPLMG